MKNFGERLLELRKQAGMTQEQLAARSGISLGTIRGYEQGRREPLWHVVPILASALGVTCEAFTGQPAASSSPPATARPAAKSKPKRK